MRPLSDEARELWKLAVPLIAGHAGNQLMSLVDTAMVGRLGAAPVGGVGVGNGIFFIFTLFGLGCMMGMEAPIAQAIGAGDEARARRVLEQGLRLAVLIGLPLTLCVFAGSRLGETAGVTPDTAAAVRAYLLGRLPNVVPFLLFAACRGYLQARGVMRPILVAMLAANATNLVANALLIYGDGALAWIGLPGIGLPALGVLGAGLASSLASATSFAILYRAVRDVSRPLEQSGGNRVARGGAARSERLGIGLDADSRVGTSAATCAARSERLGIGLDPVLSRTILRLGVPVGLQIVAEVGVFAVVSLLAGRLGAVAAAGHQVAITLASLTFTVTVGIGAATSVRVGIHVGRQDTPAARRAGLLGIASGASFMAASAIVFLAAPAWLAKVLSNKPDVIQAATPLVMVAAAFAVFDGVQAVAAGALRGVGDARAPLVANLLGHYAVGLPVAITLGFWASGGARGLWWGMCAGLAAVACGLTARFVILSARPIARVG